MNADRGSKSAYIMKNPSLGENGIVSVEFALMFPIFLLLVFSAYELGIFLYDKQVITNAAREGARFGVIMRVERPSESDIQDKVLEWSVTLVGVSLEADDITVVGAAGNSGTPLTVTVDTPFPFPLLSNFSGFAPEISVSAQTIMVLE